MNPLLPDGPMVRPVAPHPGDRYSRFTKAWLLILGAAAALEAAAMWQDKVNAGDRVKRTLSSNSRTWFATDSITGIPLDAPWGKTRRTALIAGMAWLNEHLKQQRRV